jgi:acyl-CoA synthetase
VLDLKERVLCLETLILVDRLQPSYSGLPTFSSILDKASLSVERVPVSSDDVACLLTTSGTTGRPKVAMFTHNNLIFSESVFVRELGRTQHDVMFMPSPLNHATGFFHGLIAPMLLGARTVLQQDFNAKDAVTLCNKEGATWSMGATPFIYDILRYLNENDIQSLDTLSLFLCGGAAVPEALVRHAWSKGILLCEIYGSTESCPHIYVPPEKCLEWSGAFSGIPFEGIEVRVVDSERRDVPWGIQGEEISRGPHQFVGYLNDPDRTNRQLDNDGWFYSGDLCFMDEENRIRINGRKKEIIIRGGENLCVREIDDNILGCPGLSDHATIGMPDERLGERICTFVVSWDESPPSLEDIKQYLAKAQVAKRFWPEHIEYIGAIPKTTTGKVKRHLLAAELTKRLKKDTALL